MAWLKQAAVNTAWLVLAGYALVLSIERQR